MELSIHALPIPDSTKNMVPEVTRRSANYHPSIWGDHFVTYASHAVWMLKWANSFSSRKMLVAANDQPSQKLNFIDAIQRLGVCYHFESEIEAALQHIYETDYDHHDDKGNDDLYTVALSFWLLRQQGYPISCDVFNKFKDDNGKIRESLIGDVRHCWKFRFWGRFKNAAIGLKNAVKSFCDVLRQTPKMRPSL
ncbi:unnamed protein product [Camellia sinensis]